MGFASSSSLSIATPNLTSHCSIFSYTSESKSISKALSFPTFDPLSVIRTGDFSYPSSKLVPLRCSRLRLMMETSKEGTFSKPIIDFNEIDNELAQKMVYDALVWCSLHGLVVGDKSVQRSGTVPGVAMMHAPFSLLPVPFPENQWKLACEVAPIFNELIDRVSLDAKFLQESLSRTKKVDVFTSRLLDIHSEILKMNKKEEIRLGLYRSDYMLDEQTKLLLQIEINTISASFPSLNCLVSNLHRNLLKHYGKNLGLDPQRVPENNSIKWYAEALAKAWTEYGNPRAVVLVVVQPDERNMYDQHWLSVTLKEQHNISIIRKTMAEVDEEGELLPDGTFIVDGQAVSVVYYRSAYATTDYPSEAEWRARLLMEKSIAVKCPSISYHLAGTKKIQQELAKPGVLERFLENKDDIAKLRKCFAGLWSLDNSDVVNRAIERPELFVMKPQREGGGNNIYGDDVRKNLLRLQKEQREEDAAYILMQRIFPAVSDTILVREGNYYRDRAISELGIYGAYLRNKDRVVINEKIGYLMRTKVSSSDEGGVAAGFAVLDSVYLT